MSQPNRSCQVAIVGGGPIGIELAARLSQHAVTYELYEAGAIGHTISWWAPGTRWFSSNERIAIAGVPLVTPDQTKATREQYLTYLRSVCTQFAIEVQCFQKVTQIDRQNDHSFRVTSTDRSGSLRTIRCQKVVLAIGGTDSARRLNIPGEELPFVDGYLREPHRYHGRRVMIIGGRNSAVEAALRLHHAGAQVMLSYRRDQLPTDGIKYWLAPEILGLIGSGRIQAFFATEPILIEPGSITLKHVDDATTTSHRVDEVLSLIGYEQDKTLFRSAGVQLIDAPTLRPVHDQKTMETNVPGIYVAGTATAGSQGSKYRTFLEGCHAHVDRIVGHLLGQSVDHDNPGPAFAQQAQLQPES